MLALLLTVPLLVSSPSPQPGDPAAGAHGRQCLTVGVSSPQAPGPSRGQGDAAFSATQILDVELSTLLRRNLAGEHLLELKVYTPRGHLYQVLTVPFTGAGNPADLRPRKRRVEGYPEPLHEKTLRPAKMGGMQGFAVGTTLPVAGTSIVTSSLYGRWTVVPHLDGDPEPCGAGREFTIRQ